MCNIFICISVVYKIIFIFPRHNAKCITNTCKFYVTAHEVGKYYAHYAIVFIKLVMKCTLIANH